MQRPADGKPPKRKAPKTLGKLQLNHTFMILVIILFVKIG
jgi:hypothetical protein